MQMSLSVCPSLFVWRSSRKNITIYVLHVLTISSPKNGFPVFTGGSLLRKKEKVCHRRNSYITYVILRLLLKEMVKESRKN